MRNHRCTEVSNAISVRGPAWWMNRRNLRRSHFVDLETEAEYFRWSIRWGKCGVQRGFEKAGTLKLSSSVAVGELSRNSCCTTNENLRQEWYRGYRYINQSAFRGTDTSIPDWGEFKKTSEDIRLNAVIWIFAVLISRNLMLKQCASRVMRDLWQTRAFGDRTLNPFRESTQRALRDYLVPNRIHHGHFLCASTVTTAL